MMSKYRIRLCQNLKFRFLKNWVSGKMRNRDAKTKISTFKEFGFAKSKKSAPQNLKLDYDFEFRCRKFDFEIDFSFFVMHFGTENRFQNRFLSFLSNFDLRPQNLNAAMSKTPKSTFSFQKSNFSCTEIQNFVLGRRWI